MKINIAYNEKIPEYLETLKKVESELEKRNVEHQAFDIAELGDFGDFTIALGGDGTILRTARYYSAKTRARPSSRRRTTCWRNGTRCTDGGNRA